MNAPPMRRPTSVQEMFARVVHLVTMESMERGLAFKPRPDDVLVAPYPKCGTTWLQQIVHQLRTGGDMAFDEITGVVPWLETAHDMGLDLEAPQRARPRAYKTHLTWDLVPKGGRYIVAVRDPKDVMVSQFHFWEGWFFEAGSVSMDELAEQFFLEPAMPMRYWTHLASWWPQRGRPDVLMLCYEDMCEDLPGTVRRVADFIGVALDQRLLEVVVQHASFAFMRAHARQFDDHLLREARDGACGIPPGGGAGKVRKGGAGAHRAELSAALRERIDAVWRAEFAPAFGIGSYAALREQLAEGRRDQTAGAGR
jgi:hypothetical protein